MKRFVLSFLFLATLVFNSWGHESRPAYLELTQLNETNWDVAWKVPAVGDMRLGVYLVFPESVKELQDPIARMEGGAYIERYQIQAPDGLAGATISFDGLSGTKIDVLARVKSLEAAVQALRATPDKTSITIPDDPSLLKSATTYITSGIEHIMLGVDHLLFVFALLMIVSNARMLTKTVTAFTLAHSVTLAIATLGYAAIPLPPLNASIALSILFLGPEMVRYRKGQSSLTIKYPWIVAFAFGLLHGFGFAGGLSITGLPGGEIAWALLFFNVGVEVGQIGFVFLVLALSWAFRTLQVRWPQSIRSVPAYLVGSLGAFWTIQRIYLLIIALK